MKFRITRTSNDAFQKERPCEGCVLAKPPEDYGEHDDRDWFIEIASLESFIEFVKKQPEQFGVIVAFKDNERGNPIELEIYDDHH